jgi:hypothetical protein
MNVEVWKAAMKSQLMISHSYWQRCVHDRDEIMLDDGGS